MQGDRSKILIESIKRLLRRNATPHLRKIMLLDFIEGIELDEIVQILENMAADDVADLVGKLPEEKSAAILEKMKKEGSEEVEDLLRYEDDTAGGIMVPEQAASWFLILLL